jgi:GTPase involved in cell partitioning and DNA repair
MGSGGFDKTIDYTVSIDVPSDKLGYAKSYAQGLLAKAPIPGLNGILPEILTFNLKVGGTIEKPIVNVGRMTAGSNEKSVQQQATETIKEEEQKAADDLKNKAQIEAEKQVDLAKENAQKEMDKVKAAAQKQAAEQVNKAKEQIKKNIKLPW